MRIGFAVVPPGPGQIATSYTYMKYANYGCFRWLYDGFAGPTHYINALLQCTEPEYPGANGFEYWTPRGIFVVCAPIDAISPNADPPSLNINNLNINPATGEGMSDLPALIE
jgi:hypothetical protein